MGDTHVTRTAAAAQGQAGSGAPSVVRRDSVHKLAEAPARGGPRRLLSCSSERGVEVAAASHDEKLVEGARGLLDNGQKVVKEEDVRVDEHQHVCRRRRQSLAQDAVEQGRA